MEESIYFDIFGGIIGLGLGLWMLFFYWIKRNRKKALNIRFHGE